MLDPLVAAMALQVTAPPAPPAPPPPPMIVPMPQTYEMGPVVPVQIRASGDGGLLWEGTLQVGAGVPATYNENRMEAPARQCSERTVDRSTHMRFGVSISKISYERSSDRYRVEANWTHPLEGAACGESGSQAVQLSQTVALPPGRTVTVSGNGGLSVQLTRR